MYIKNNKEKAVHTVVILIYVSESQYLENKQREKSNIEPYFIFNLSNINLYISYLMKKK